MKIRLQKIIAESGMASRRQAEQWIAEGIVRVNGQVVERMGTMADPFTDFIKVGRRRVPPSEKRQYLVLFKPTGCMTTVEDNQGRPTVMEYIKKVETRLFPVGRLDFNTQGILLFTNDGDLSKKLLDPKYKIERTYQVKIRGIPEDKTLNRLRKGVSLNGRSTQPMSVELERDSGKNCFLTLKLIEGKNRHIKRVCEKVGHPVIRIKRTQFAFLSLKGLRSGEYRFLNPKEIQLLHRMINESEKKIS